MGTETPATTAKPDLSDRATWPDVVREHYDRVFRTALSQTRRVSLAEDIAQEVFIRAFERYDRFDGEGSLGAWLYRITVNLSRDVLRRENVRSHAGLSKVREVARDDPPPPEVVHRKHLAQVLRQALDNVSEPMRRAFEHTVLLGYTYKEAAQIEGVSEGTIASRVARTRNTLAKKCSELDA